MHDPADTLVHGPLAGWAATRPLQLAVEQDGRPVLDFAALHTQVLGVAARLQQAQAPADVLLADDGSPAQRLVELLGTLHAGRCAAVGDPEWPAALRERVRAALVAAPPATTAPTPDTAFYVGFTSGSTGVPKGFRRSHRSWTESFRACTAAFGEAARGPVFVPGAASSSLALFGLLLGLWGGGGVGLLSRFSAARLLAALAGGRHACIVAVPSQLLALIALAQHRGQAPLPAPRLLLIGGARWPQAHTAALRALFPRARLVSFYGASETSFVSWRDLDDGTPDDCVGRPFDGVELQLREADADGIGLLHVRSPMLFEGYVGAAAQAPGAARRDAGGWLAVGDLGRLDADGRLWLAGRRERVIVSRGHKVHAEQLEACLAAAPGVAAVSVQPVEEDRRGAIVVAVVQPQPGAAGDAAAFVARLAAFCRERLPAAQRPRRIVLRGGDWPCTPAGKTDHPAIARWLAEAR